MPRIQLYPESPVFLPAAFDPLQHCAASMVGVSWQGPIILHAGDAIWIRRGWWHCIASDPGCVGLPVEVVASCVRGDAPRVFRHVAPRKRAGRAGTLVSRRPCWASAASVRQLFAVALSEEM